MIDSGTNKSNNLQEVSYDDIRPFDDAEVKAAIDSLLADNRFRKAVEGVISPISWADFSKGMSQY